MWFWNKKKDKKKKEVVISHSSYAKLPLTHQQHFSPVPGSPAAVDITHEVVHHDDSGSNFSLGLLAGMEMGDSNYVSIPAVQLADPTPDFGGFGGGDTGGAGAGGSWDSGSSMPDSTPAIDTSSSSPDSGF